MKKVFTLFFALFTLAFFANAQQVTVILEAHNVWGDGTGYQLLLDADHTAYGTVIPTYSGLTSDATTTVDYSATFEYTIPANANGSANSTNVVVDGSVTITIPAGTYDFCVTNPTPGDRIWIAAGENGRKDDYVFDPAYIYHFTVAMNGENDAVTIDLIPATTDPIITVAPATLEMNALLNSFTTASAQVNGFNLTAGITATTAAPFEVSADGTTYDTTATIAQTGGPLYVKYTPTAAGTDNGTITLASTGANNVTITVTGTAIDCSNPTIPYSFAFDNESMAQCWTINDANNDSTTFIISTASGYAYYPYNSDSPADDWLISPVFNLTGSQYASIDYAARSTTYPERFQVFAMGSQGNVPLSPVIDVTSTTPQTLLLDLSTLTGNYSIGFHCISDEDMYWLILTNFEVNNIDGSTVSINETALDFSIIPANTTSDMAAVVMSSINFNEAVALTAPASFEVSTDGLIFSSTATIPANSAMIAYDTVYVRFAPTTAGVFDGNIMFTSASYTDSIYVEGEAVDCSQGIAALPFTYDFNTGLYPPVCWNAVNEENYSGAAVDDEDMALAINAIDRLITPEIHSTAPMLLSFEYGSDEGESYPTKFRVGFSSTDMAEASFTFLSEVTAPAGLNAYTTIVPAGTKYIAIDITEVGSYVYWFWQVANVLYIDNFNLTAISEPMILVDPTSLNLGSIELGNQSVKSANVLTALLTDAITVTAPANFEVSGDNGSTYAATTTLPATGGNLLVKYNPTAAGTHNGTVTLTSGTSTANITVRGKADDCSTAENTPFYEDFEGDLSACWTNIDNDGDGYSWMSTLDFTGGNIPAFSGEGAYISESYNDDGALTPENWLISPAINIPATGANLSWWVAAQDDDYANEHYEVKVSTNGSSLSNFTSVFNETLSSNAWAQKVVNLNDYAGQTIRIAFVHNNCTNMFILKIDDIYVGAGVGINEVEENAIAVYPNPANNVINVNATSNISNVEVYTITGQKVGDFTANSTNTRISTANLTTGLYLMRIHTDNGVINKKFSVAR